MITNELYKDFKDNMELIKEEYNYTTKELIELCNDLVFNMEHSNSLDIDNAFKVTKQLTTRYEKELIASNSIAFDVIKKGDTINYDLLLLNGNTKNETSLVRDIYNNVLTLSLLHPTWKCTKEFYTTNLLNVSIIESD